MLGYVSQAYHTAELLCLSLGFHGTGTKRKLNPAQEPLADQMVTAFTNFMHADYANAKRNAPWLVFGINAKNYMAFNADGLSTISDAEFGTVYQCDIWIDILSNN